MVGGVEAVKVGVVGGGEEEDEEEEAVGDDDEVGARRRRLSCGPRERRETSGVLDRRVFKLAGQGY